MMMILDCRLSELEQCAFLVMKLTSHGEESGSPDKRSDFYNRKSQRKENSAHGGLVIVDTTKGHEQMGGQGHKMQGSVTLCFEG